MAEANQILTDLRGRGVLFGLGASIYDWDDPFGRLFLQTLAMVAEFEANLNHLRTREGMVIAKRKGKQPKLPESAQRFHPPPLRRQRGVAGRPGRRVQRRPFHHPPRHPPPAGARSGQRIRHLREQIPPPGPASRHGLLDRVRENTRPYAARGGHELAVETVAEMPLTAVTSADERAELAGWVAEMTGWWTATESLHALDDLVAGLPLEEVSRICGEEGLHRVADWEDHGDLEVFVASDDGLLGALFVPADSGGPAPWELRIFFNAEIADFAWFPRPAGTFRRVDGRRLATGSYGFHLRHASGAGRSLRVTLAALRASSRILTPWELPVYLSLGPEMPRGMEHYTDTAPEHAAALDQARMATNRAALDQLPAELRARYGPLLAP
jgi:hypothetical protein